MAGMFLCSPISCTMSFAGSLIGALTGAWLGADPSMIRSGLWSYNSVLGAAAIGGIFYVPTPMALCLSLLCAWTCALFGGSLASGLKATGMPTMTYPFCIMTMVFLFLQRGGGYNLISIPLANITTPEIHLGEYLGILGKFNDVKIHPLDVDDNVVSSQAATLSEMELGQLSNNNNSAPVIPMMTNTEVVSYHRLDSASPRNAPQRQQINGVAVSDNIWSQQQSEKEMMFGTQNNLIQQSIPSSLSEVSDSETTLSAVTPPWIDSPTKLDNIQLLSVSPDEMSPPDSERKLDNGFFF
jgi:hypothetical protein